MNAWATLWSSLRPGLRPGLRPELRPGLQTFQDYRWCTLGCVIIWFVSRKFFFGSYSLEGTIIRYYSEF